MGGVLEKKGLHCCNDRPKKNGTSSEGTGDDGERMPCSSFASGWLIA